MTQQLKAKLYSLSSDTGGNFAITTAVLIPTLFAAASVALNLTTAVAESDALIPKNWTVHNWSFPR